MNVACIAPTSEKRRPEKLGDARYSKADIGGGAEVVARTDLDPREKLSHAIVMDARLSGARPPRLMATDAAGKG